MVGQFMANRAEDAMRRMMGMPSRKEEKRRRRKAAASGASGRSERNSRKSGASSRQRRHPSPRQSAAALLRSVAVDVEYSETVEFGETEIGGGSTTKIVYEEQVSDVQYTEYKS